MATSTLMATLPERMSTTMLSIWEIISMSMEPTEAGLASPLLRSSLFTTTELAMDRLVTPRPDFWKGIRSHEHLTSTARIPICSFCHRTLLGSQLGMITVSPAGTSLGLSDDWQSSPTTATEMDSLVLTILKNPS